MMSQGFEEIIGSDGCDDNDIMRWPIVIAIIRSHVNYTEMMTDAGWSGVMMTMSVLTSVSWHHVTNVTWHQLRPRDMCLRLSPVTKLSISSIQMSSPPSHASVSALVDSRERGELNWNHLKWSILHHRIGLTLKTTIYNAPTEHGWIKTDCDRHQMYSHHAE